MRLRRCFIVSFLVCSSLTKVYADIAIPLQQIRQISDGGAPGLAITLIDQQHPGIDKGFSEWFRWTKTRIAILTNWQQWQRASEYLQSLPPSLPEPLQRWAKSQRAWLALERGDTQMARQLLRELIWGQGAEKNNPIESGLFRRLITRSYVIDGNVDDAATTVNRYQQDYADDRPEWLQLRASILLSQERPEIILNWPEQQLEGLAPALRLLTELRAQRNPPQAIVEKARYFAADENLGLASRAKFWKVAVEAYGTLDDKTNAVQAIEQAIWLSRYLSSSDKIFQVGTEQWWQTLHDFGIELANKYQLLLGDDISLLAAVKNLAETEPNSAKALLVAMSMESSRSATRQKALAQLASMLQSGNEDDAEGLYLTSRLFADHNVLNGDASVPAEVRYQLVEYALSNGDIKRASDLMASLDTQPEGVDAFNWHLRRARTLVMGGRAEQGSAILDQLLDDELFIEAEQLDKLMQVIFDLQSSEHHDQALSLFRRLQQERQLAPKQRRELFYWMAESLEASEQYSQAALYFMRSATYVDGSGDDLWGQSARYNAAEALTKAGLINDARRVYRALLKVTQDPARLAVLHGKLQQLFVSPRGEDDI